MKLSRDVLELLYRALRSKGALLGNDLWETELSTRDSKTIYELVKSARGKHYDLASDIESEVGSQIAIMFLYSFNEFPQQWRIFEDEENPSSATLDERKPRAKLTMPVDAKERLKAYIQIQLLPAEKIIDWLAKLSWRKIPGSEDQYRAVIPRKYAIPVRTHYIDTKAALRLDSLRIETVEDGGGSVTTAYINQQDLQVLQPRTKGRSEGRH